MDQRLVASLQRLEHIRNQIGDGIIQRIAQLIEEAAHQTQRVRLCPHCGRPMVRDGTMYTCPACGLCRDDSDEPTADFSEVAR